MAYATQCVAPIVVPGKKVESTRTKAIAVDFTASLGACISSNGRLTSIIKDCIWILPEVVSDKLNTRTKASNNSHGASSSSVPPVISSRDRRTFLL